MQKSWFKLRNTRAVCALALSLPVIFVVSSARADEAPSLPDATEDESVEVVEETPTQIEKQRTAEERVDELEDKLARLDAELRQAQQMEMQKESTVNFSGYVDFGFFVPT